MCAAEWVDEVVPFRIDIDDAALADLRDRLRAARWPERETVDDDSQGVSLAYLRQLCGHWLDGYDWRAREARLNELAQWRTTIDGLGIHFFHLRSPHADAVPLLITHGWPGSVVEFLDVIGPLTDPTAHGGDRTDAFHVVCPSLPGYGFSDRPMTRGWNVQHIAEAWATLMARLGYEHYLAQGGDWGAMVTTALGALDPEHVAGIHLNMPVVLPDQSHPFTSDEQRIVDDTARYRAVDSGYAKVQSTRPQTIGYGLVDSPIGLAAWIVEKLWSWTDHGGDMDALLGRDSILDNVMLYWLPATGASAGRLYWEATQAFTWFEPVVPVGCSIFPKEIMRSSRRWAEAQFSTLAYWVSRAGAVTSPRGNSRSCSSMSSARAAAPWASVIADQVCDGLGAAFSRSKANSSR